MSNINPHKKSKSLEKWKKILGQYKFARLCATIKWLERNNRPYSISKLARMSRKDLLKLRQQPVIAVYRSVTSEPIPLKSGNEFIAV